MHVTLNEVRIQARPIWEIALGLSGGLTETKGRREFFARLIMASCLFVVKEYYSAVVAVGYRGLMSQTQRNIEMITIARR